MDAAGEALRLARRRADEAVRGHDRLAAAAAAALAREERRLRSMVGADARVRAARVSERRRAGADGCAG